MISIRYLPLVFTLSFFIAPNLVADPFMGFELPLAAEARKEPAKTPINAINGDQWGHDQCDQWGQSH